VSKDDRHSSVRFESPLLRLIIWPFYSVWEIGFIFLISVIAYLGLGFLDVDNRLIVTLGGLAGAWVVLIWSAPSNMVTSSDGVREIERALTEMEYVRTECGWTPPLPRFLRWRHNRLELFELADSSFLVRGPRNLLLHLQDVITGLR
jgi:hypothetical protein